MSYRSDLTAATARIHSLEEELAAAQGLGKKTDKARKPVTPKKRGQTFGTLRYDSPACYFPLLKLGWKSSLFALDALPSGPDLNSSNVFAWLFYRALVPLYAIARMLYVLVILLLATPYVLAASGLLSIVSMPYVFMRHVRFAREGCPVDDGVWAGQASNDALGSYFFLLALPTGVGLLVALPAFIRSCD